MNSHKKHKNYKMLTKNLQRLEQSILNKKLPFVIYKKEYIYSDFIAILYIINKHYNIFDIITNSNIEFSIDKNLFPNEFNFAELSKEEQSFAYLYFAEIYHILIDMNYSDVTINIFDIKKIKVLYK